MLTTAHSGEDSGLEAGRIYLTHIDDVPHLGRWYAMHVQVDLFGGVDLVCRWGKHGLAGGRERRQRFADEAAAWVAMRKIIRQRLRLGYQLRPHRAS